VAQRTAANGLLGSLLAVPIDSAGNRTEGGQGNKDHRNLVFREADVIGHPVSSLSSIVAGAGYLCNSQTISFFPYFQSGLDALSWRMEIPEMFYPASLIPGLREIGTWPLQTWGGVYPRTGWTTQAEEPKAAAINAQRAGDIVTRRGQPHIYVPITGGSSSRQRVWPPGPLIEDDPDTGEWQMLLPRAESTCKVFGTNDLASFTGWGGGRVDAQGDYAWNLWRPYSCCRDRGIFLFNVDWINYPP
jgi:integrating conjugative element protein (TIGR03756 family)